MFSNQNRRTARARSERNIFWDKENIAINKRQSCLTRILRIPEIAIP